MEREKSAQLIQECPMCGLKYQSVSVRAVRETDVGNLLYFKCSQCQSGLVASVMDAPFGLIGSGLVTDLQFDEVEKFIQGEVISEDDVLSVHSILEKKNKITRSSVCRNAS